jgi:hypothetical protein
MDSPKRLLLRNAPLKTVDKLNTESEIPLMGIVKYSDNTVDVGDLVGFRPSSEYEFYN